jgi:hypothetical protein
MARYKEVTIAVGIMYVNKIRFLMTVSRHIKFGTAEMIKSETGATLLAAINQVNKAYSTRGFIITSLLAVDGQFEPLGGDLADLGIALNSVSRDGHVPEIEGYIRTSKEHTQCNFNMSPFKKLPPRIVTEMVYCSVFWLNMFPLADGKSNTISPCTLVAGHKLDYVKHCRLEFGACAQVHEQHEKFHGTKNNQRHCPSTSGQRATYKEAINSTASPLATASTETAGLVDVID